ncbi:MAG: deoxyribodipyrimidine photo-lyase [Bacteroidales bacterium]
MNNQRIFSFNNLPYDKGESVVYWMSRDQRVFDNHAMLASARLASRLNKPLVVVFCLTEDFPGANLRMFDFLLKGLTEVSRILADLKIPFYVLKRNPIEELPLFLRKNICTALISDFDPLRIKRQWKDRINEQIGFAHYEVDAHNIVPCRVASTKEEFAAYTIRPKINRLLPDFIGDLPDRNQQKNDLEKAASQSTEEFDAETCLLNLLIDRSVPPLSLESGETSARMALHDFIEYRLNGYSELRNFPEKNHQSNLSPYLHFGQLSAQRVALEVQNADVSALDKAAFLEELIVRRELSDNYCFNNPNYDNIAGVAAWAKKTLSEHEHDTREYLYSIEQFENAKTHDLLWNAAQKQLLQEGKIHGYMRMYWAKKILEWTKSPAEALQFAIYLNDKYSIDGRDPNGYVGCQWAIGGVHDRAWGERPVFGKIRYMNANGCKRKFDVEAYINGVERFDLKS